MCVYVCACECGESESECVVGSDEKDTESCVRASVVSLSLSVLLEVMRKTLNQLM